MISHLFAFAKASKVKDLLRLPSPEDTDLDKNATKHNCNIYLYVSEDSTVGYQASNVSPKQEKHGCHPSPPFDLAGDEGWGSERTQLKVSIVKVGPRGLY